MIVSQFDWKVEVWLLEGCLVIRTCAKGLSVWVSEFAHTRTFQAHTQYNLMTRFLKPLRQHMLNMTNQQCERQVRHLWWIVEWPQWRLHDSAYNIMWECDRCVHGEHNSHKLQHHHDEVMSMKYQSTYGRWQLVEQVRKSKTCKRNISYKFSCLHTCMLLRTWWYDDDKQSCELN